VEEKTMIVTNKGKRSWPVKNAAGEDITLQPTDSVEMTEIAALRLINGYPQDIAPAGPATMSSATLAREEQSLRDRITNVEKREKAVKEREDTVEAKELGLVAPSLGEKKNDDTLETPVKKPGRPPRAEK